MKRHAVAVMAALGARRGLVYGLLVIVNGLHALIHGTVLDGGSLDAAVASLDTWAVNAILADG